MSHDSRDAGYRRGHAAGLSGEPEPRPKADAATKQGDHGWAQFWDGVRSGYADGQREREAQQAAGGVR